MMRRWFLMVIMAILMAGCGGGSFTVPKEQYRERVRTLGVLPLLLDEGSTILHPEREAVVDMLRRYNTATQGVLVDLITNRKDYFDVRPIAGDPREVFAQLVGGNNPTGKGDELHPGYQLRGDVIAQLAQRNVVDALLVVIFNGVERTEKRWDRTKLTFLKADYNVILASALVVSPEGEVLVEYHGAPGEGFLPLQYPDFDEAFYNKSDEVKIRFISIPGLERTLAERETALFGKGTWPKLHKKLYEKLAAELSPGMINPLRNQPQ